MKRRLLAIKPDSSNYIDLYTVTVARSFEEAKTMIRQAEEAGTPFDDLDLPVYDRKAFEDFINWMISTNRKYPFSIFGFRNPLEFMNIRNKARSCGFHFND